jgi:hypothetical protein
MTDLLWILTVIATIMCALMYLEHRQSMRNARCMRKKQLHDWRPRRSYRTLR